MESQLFGILYLTLVWAFLGTDGQPQNFTSFLQPYTNGQQKTQHPFGNVFLSQGRVVPYSQGFSGFSSPYGSAVYSSSGSGFSSIYGTGWFSNPQTQGGQPATLVFGSPTYPPGPVQPPAPASAFGPPATMSAQTNPLLAPWLSPYQPVPQQQSPQSPSHFQNSQGAFPSTAQVSGRSFCLTPGCVEAAAYLISNINSSADPCDDFYQYACGKWISQQAMPADKPLVSAMSIITDRVENRLRGLLESNEPLSIGPSNAVNSARKFYKACTDTEALSRLKSRPLYDALTALGAWPILGTPSTSAFDLTRTVALLTSRYAVTPLWFSYTLTGWSVANPNDATRWVLKFEQAKLNLGAKDTYLDGRPHSTEILRAYQRRIERSVELIAADAGLNVNKADVSAQAANIIEFEKKLARLTKNDEERRNRTLQNNMWTLRDLRENVRVINWDAYFDAIMPSDVRQLFRGDQAQVQITEPQFFRDLVNLLSSTDAMYNTGAKTTLDPYVRGFLVRLRVRTVYHLHELKTLANYLLWCAVWNLSPALDERFLDLNQELDRAMSGQQQRSPKFQTCINALMRPMQHALGAMYIDRHFTEADKAEANALVKNLIAALDSIIKDVQWMDEQTKQSALRKLQHVQTSIGYMDFIKNVAQLDEYYKELSFLQSDSHLEMRAKLSSFMQRLHLRKLAKPVDRSEMEMSPAMVNAYYSWEQNHIVFPAAELQPFFFRGDFPKAFNYGAIGSVIGHELTHGFDDTGSQYDEVGNLRNWWSTQSARGFEANKRCIVDQYSSYRVDAINMTVNGELTVGENIADNGGLKEAFRAYKLYRIRSGEEPLLPGLNMNSEQVFFTAYAAGWCAKMRPQVQIQQLMGDPHSPGQFRVIGPLSNSDDFARAFNCRPGTRMNPVKTSKSKCIVW